MWYQQERGKPRKQAGKPAQGTIRLSAFTRGGNVVIERGLRTGDAVIVTGAAGLTPGEPIRVTDRRAPVRVAAGGR